MDADGASRMVDVGDKPVTERWARAEGFVTLAPELERQVREQTLAKGSLIEVVRLAGIQAAKRTDELIPLCHALPLDSVQVQATLEPGRLRVEATARTHARTGVEMEALTAVAVACLTAVDMGKAVDRGMAIGGIRLLEKHGGRGGSWVAGPSA